jgi:DDE family transposase
MFGQIKQAGGFRQILLRGVEKVAVERGVICIAHNILSSPEGGLRPSSDAAAA